MKDSCVYKNINTIYAYVYLVKKVRKKKKGSKERKSENEKRRINKRIIGILIINELLQFRRDFLTHLEPNSQIQNTKIWHYDY